MMMYKFGREKCLFGLNAYNQITNNEIEIYFPITEFSNILRFDNAIFIRLVRFNLELTFPK